MTSKQLKLLVSFGFAVPIGVILVVVLWHLNDTIAWTTTAFGLVAGWAAGILAAPYKSEQQHFEKIGGVVGGFVGGFAVSEVDTILPFGSILRTAR